MLNAISRYIRWSDCLHRRYLCLSPSVCTLLCTLSVSVGSVCVCVYVCVCNRVAALLEQVQALTGRSC